MNTPQANMTCNTASYNCCIEDMRKLEGNGLESVIKLTGRLKDYMESVEDTREKIYSLLEKKPEDVHDAAAILDAVRRFNQRRMEYESVCKEIKKSIIAHLQ